MVQNSDIDMKNISQNSTYIVRIYALYIRQQPKPFSVEEFDTETSEKAIAVKGRRKNIAEKYNN